jgi:FkbM family methyltransferase
MRRESSLLVYGFLMLACLAPTELQAQRNRDSWQRVPDVLVALAIDEGSHVADVGAGEGYFTRHLARTVGTTGRVYAVEISDRALRQLRRLADDEGFENVEVVEGDVDDPKLPERTLDAILVVSAYHEMTEHEAMLAGMFASLKPGGRLVMLERAADDSSDSREQQVRRHELSIDLVEEEFRQAGFDILEREEVFTNRGHPQWMLVARR